MNGRRRPPSLRTASVRIPVPDGGATSDADSTAAVLVRIETTLRDVQHTLSIQFQRIASMQAELDKLALTVREHLAEPPAVARKSHG
jgi:hypothetical protein